MKNAIIYRTPKGWPESAALLSEAIKPMAFVPCHPSEPESFGFVLPAHHAEGFAHRVGNQIILTLQTETKILPKQVVERAVADMVAKIEEREGRTVGRRERKELAEVVTADLLPRVFTTLSRINAYLFPDDGRLVIDTASQKKADDFAEILRHIFPDNDIKPLQTNRRPSDGMTEWLQGEAPDGLTVDDECTLVRDDDDNPTVKYLHHSLDGEDIEKHLACGKRPTQLAITCNDRASFVLTDKLHIKRFVLPDVVAIEIGEQETMADRFDAEIALNAGEMKLVIDAIEEALGGPAREAA
jgi:recombination associated protein RdgC